MEFQEEQINLLGVGDNELGKGYFKNLHLEAIYKYTEIGSSLILFLTSLFALIYTLASK